jgi:two-component system phosphate regulon sensor histidine kinase PhoR
MRVDFVANASHELRTPLTAILGFIDTLEGSAKDDAPMRQTFLGVMREQAQRMRRLIDDLLSLSSIEVKAHVLPEEPVDLMTTVREALESLRTLAQNHGVILDFVPSSTRFMVKGDRDELIRVAENLIENAIKYGGSGGRVSITLEEKSHAERHDILLSIRDFGTGIPHEHIPRLTERFYRVDVAGSRAKGGTGLGLAIVKHIINRHQGRLEVHSVLGEGTTFQVVLPKFSD